MGLFLAASGVIGGDIASVREQLAQLCPAPLKKLQVKQCVFASGPAGVTVVYPEHFCEWDEASELLSAKTGKPVMSFHVHDGDLWMFRLFADGKDAARFNPIPDYWDGHLSPEERAQWAGDAQAVAALVPGLRPDSIVKYFAPWDREDTENSKAYPDDEFPCGDCWQMVDFMRRCGLAYPDFGQETSEPTPLSEGIPTWQAESIRHLERVRAALVEAWKRKDHRQVMQLVNRIPPAERTPAETDMLARSVQILRGSSSSEQSKTDPPTQMNPKRPWWKFW